MGRHGIIWDAFPVPEEGVQTWEMFKKQTAGAKPFMAPISAVDPEARETFGAMDVIGFLDNTIAQSCLITGKAEPRAETWHPWPRQPRPPSTLQA